MTRKQMEAYRERLGRQRIWRRILLVIWILLFTVVAYVCDEYLDPEGEQTMLFAIRAISFFLYWKVLDQWKLSRQEYLTLRCDDAALRARWYKEHDERELMIRMHAGAPFVDYMFIALNVAALIAAPFSVPVSMTLIVVAMVQEGASGWLRDYWVRKLTGAEASEEDA